MCTHVQGDSLPTPDPQASAGSAGMPMASAVCKGETSDLPATNTALAPSKTASGAKTPVVINTGDQVKLYSMLRPGQRQQEVALLKVGRQPLTFPPAFSWQNSSELAGKCPHF